MARFDKARILISEPSEIYARALRSVLHGLGFRQFFAFDTLAEIRAELLVTSFDLWITNVHLPDGAVFDFVHDIRHGQVGQNIFLPVILQNLYVTEDMVKRTLNAGADLLWRMPFTGGQIASGVDYILHHRRPFVVTCDYIGPDRRTKPRSDGVQIPLLQVPNPLRAAAEPDHAPPDYVGIMKQINEQKVEAQAYQIGWLCERIAPLLGADKDSEMGRAYLKRLQRMAQDLMQRVVMTKYLHQAELCRTLLFQARKVAAQPDPEEIELLKELVRAVRIAFRTIDDSDADMALAIAQQVRGRTPG